jgi:LPXTG-motif cell wall-anchored protein
MRVFIVAGLLCVLSAQFAHATLLPCLTATCSHPAPAPEMGASAIGMAFAVAAAVYLRRRRKR